MNDLMPSELIEKQILYLRGQKIILSNHLADLYGVETRSLNQAVKRNLKRFPEDFMFQLTAAEAEQVSRSQFVILKRGQNIKYLPYAFTEQGIAMLSSVLNSERAIQVNIAIMRAFVKLREIMSTHKDLARKINDMEKKYDHQFKIVFDAIKQLLAAPEPKKQRIGFRREKE